MRAEREVHSMNAYIGKGKDRKTRKRKPGTVVQEQTVNEHSSEPIKSCEQWCAPVVPAQRKCQYEAGSPARPC
jgi:hypothetical protein